MRKQTGFSLVELLTVISIMVLLVGITVPALNRVQLYARQLVSVRNQRDIVAAVTLFACDHDQQFPSSVAVCRKSDGSWRWEDPRKVRTTRPCVWMEHSSVAGYLNEYLPEADRWFCPNIPEPHPYWRQAWEAADTWDHPDTPFDPQDWLVGSYCLYWNYVGYRPDGPFRGATSLYGGPGESTVLVSDYFGYNDERNRGRYGSCEISPDASVVAGDDFSSSYWSCVGSTDNLVDVRLHGGYIDGHVKRYRPAQTQRIEASEVPNGSQPYRQGDPRNPSYFHVSK